jgi:hypothetical protein
MLNDDGHCDHDAIGSSLTKIAFSEQVLKAADLEEFVTMAQLEYAYGQAMFALHAKAAMALAKVAEDGPGRLQEAVASVYGRIYSSFAVRATASHLDAVYRLGKTAGVRRAQRKISTDLRYDYAPLLRVEKADVPPDRANQPVVPSAFTLVDERAIEALTRNYVFWFSGRYVQDISNIVREVIRSQLEIGGTRRSSGAALAQRVLRELGLTDAGRELALPAGWRGSFKRYFEGLAATVTTTGRVAGSIAGLDGVGARRFKIVNPLDERTCARCEHMNGMTFPLSAGKNQTALLTSARSEADVKSAQPWYSVREFGELIGGYGSEKDPERMMSLSVVLPSYHFLCRCTVDIVY